MINTARDLVFFVRRSWAFLGCNRGTGRWAARRHYVRHLIPVAWRFLRVCRQDRAKVS